MVVGSCATPTALRGRAFFGTPISNPAPTKVQPRSPDVLRLLLICGHGLDVDAAALLVEEDGPFDEGEQGVIASDADIAAGVPFRAALPGQNVPRNDRLAAELFDSQPLGMRLAAVAAPNPLLLFGPLLSPL